MNNIIKRSGNCKGCVGCNGQYNQDGYCPCSNCLIKTMCGNECDTYYEFSDILTLIVGDTGQGKKEIRRKLKQEMEKSKNEISS